MDDGSTSPLWGIAVFLLFVVFNGIFYGFGSAIQNISVQDVEKKADGGDKKSLHLMELIDNPHRFVDTITVLTTLLGVCFGYFAISAFIRMLAPYIYNGPAMVVVIALSVILLLALGVLSFKKIGAHYPERTAYTYVNFVRFFMKVFQPYTAVITGLSGLVVRLFGIDPLKSTDDVTEEEIISMVDEAHEQGVIEESEAEMIQNIMEFSDKDAKDIMTHRKNIIALDADMALEEAVRVMLEENNSRYPVYAEDLDNILGIIHLRDVMKIITKSERPLNKPLKEIPGLIRHVGFIPETRNINDIFHYMQAMKTHMVMVVDEYGQTSGLVAMEDILEEIVGNILDEYDEDEVGIQTLYDGSVLIDGLTHLEDVEEELGTEFQEEDFETLNGYLTSILGHIPTEEDTLVTAKGWKFHILTVENNTIQRVRAEQLSKEENKGEKETCQDIQNSPT